MPRITVREVAAITVVGLIACNPATDPAPSGPEAPSPRIGWTSLAPMPEARTESGVAALDGIVYVAGGVAAGADGWVARRDIFAYDPGTNRWRTAGTLIHPVWGAGMAALGGRIYVVGGWGEQGPVSDLQILDPATGHVESGTPLPSPMWLGTATVLGGRLHAIGAVGWNEDDPICSLCGTSFHEVFDPSTGAWSSRATPPSGLYPTAADTVNGKIHLVRGGTGGHLAVYDPEADSWTTSGGPLGRVGAAAVALGGKLYVIGGGEMPTACCNGPSPTGVVDRFDPQTAIWDQVMPMPTRRSGHGAAVVGQSIYVLGGPLPDLEGSPSAANERFTPE